MDVDQLIAKARDAVTVKRVFGEPYEKNGLTVIPAAMVMGGGGGGSGTDDKGADGQGGGFGMHARPVGAFVIKGDTGELAPLGGPQPRARRCGRHGGRVAGHPPCPDPRAGRPASRVDALTQPARAGAGVSAWRRTTGR